MPKETQFLKILKVLINGHFDGLQKNTLYMISPRNHIYNIERLFNEKLDRKRVKSDTGKYYTQYIIPNLNFMIKVIELYKKKGGELSPNEETHALSRFNKKNNV